jgi:hypothetical protein
MITPLRLLKPRHREGGVRMTHGRVYCEKDQWSFDPRYTQGKCPICGWAPVGVPSAPRWLRLANRVDWDMLGLFLFADLLVLLGLVVANATGLLPVSGHR